MIRNPAEGEPQGELEVVAGTMRKLSPDEISELELPKSDSPLITGAIRTNKDGSREVIHILRTTEGSAFELGPENPLLQELQVAAAGAAIDSFEAQTPIQTAVAIKKAIQEYAGKGIIYKGSPFEAWDFAIKALEKMREFQTIQLEVIQLNAMQAATRQLQKDQSLPLHKWMLLPPHRKQAAMLLTEMGLAAAMQRFIGPETVDAAKNMKEINVALAERRKELMEMWVNSFRDTTLGIASKTGETAINLVGQLISQANTNSSDLAQSLMKFVFGQELADEGALKALLERSGDAGMKILELVSESGLGINGFFRNLFSREEKTQDI